MAENKKSFILYADQIDSFESLTDKEAGQLIKHIYRYVNDKNPTAPNKIIKIAFEPIKNQMKRDLKEWERKLEKRSEAGKIGGAKSAEARRSKLKQNEAIVGFDSKIEANEAVNVNDNVTVNVNDTVIRESTGAHPLENSNLFRKPTIPTLTHVIEVFCRSGGSEDMAKKFYEKHDSVEWFLNGSPIKNFAALVPSYIQNWKKYQDGKTVKGSDSAKPGSMRTAC